MKKSKVAIIIVNWNQPELTVNTIKSFQNINQSVFDYHLYLVDNHSSDNSLTIFSKKYSANSKISILTTQQNLGFTGGNNYGLKQALSKNYDYYLCLNNDVQVDPDFLSNMISYQQSNPSVGLVAPKMYFAPGYEYHKSRYSKKDLGNVIWFAGGKIDWNNIYCTHIGIDEVDVGQYDNIIHPDYLTGCCLLITKKLINKIGTFDHNYYLYLEDADLSYRAKQAGFLISYLPSAKIWHYNSGSSGANSDLHHYYLTRNRLYFGFRYASFRTKLSLLKQSISMLFNSPSSWQKRGIIDYYLGRMKQGSWK